MKKKALSQEEILTICKGLFDHFNNDLEFESHGRTVRGDFGIDLYKTVKGDDFILKFGKNDNPGSIENEEMSDDLFELSSNISAIAFSFGFAMGQTLESTNPEDRKSIKAIMEVIREKALLPYLPKERR